MSTKKHKLRILSILRDNLRENPPQLVSSTTIAGQMNMNLPELQQVLKSMEGMGVIETDPDQQYNLITREGLLWFMQQQPQA
jgi:predicted transcriptional regulator